MATPKRKARLLFVCPGIGDHGDYAEFIRECLYEALADFLLHEADPDIETDDTWHYGIINERLHDDEGDCLPPSGFESEKMLFMRDPIGTRSWLVHRCGQYLQAIVDNNRDLIKDAYTKMAITNVGSYSYTKNHILLTIAGTSPMIKTHVIPTPGIENLSNYYIIQKLIQERIRSSLLGITFSDNIFRMVCDFVAVPHELNKDDPKMVKKFMEETADRISKDFRNYEDTTPAYRDAIALLKDYAGSLFSTVSVTLSGIHLTIQTI